MFFGQKWCIITEQEPGVVFAVGTSFHKTREDFEVFVSKGYPSEAHFKENPLERIPDEKIPPELLEQIKVAIDEPKSRSDGGVYVRGWLNRG